MNKKKKLILIIVSVVLIVALATTGTIIGINIKKEKDFNEKFYRYEKVIPNVAEEGDSTFPDDDGTEIVVKDIERYSIIDYAFGADKNYSNDALTKSGGLIDYIKNDDKFRKKLVDDEEIKAAEEDMESIGYEDGDDIDNVLRMHPIYHDFDFEGFIKYDEDDKENYNYSCYSTVHTTSYNLSVLELYKSEFEHEKYFGNALYGVFNAIVSKYSKEEILESINVAVAPVKYDSLYESVEKGDYDVLFNALMNGAVTCRFEGKDTIVSFDMSKLPDENDLLIMVSCKVFF